MNVVEEPTLSYAGFWIRLWANLIDSILILMIIFPVLIGIYGMDYLTSSQMSHGVLDFMLSWVFPAVATILFWKFKGATPGKMAIGARIVDARTGQPASTAQLIGRYIGYYPSMLALCMGYVWIGIDKRKQGWHDMLASTVVIRRPSRPLPVQFDVPESQATL
jgi:uncharacterized RDD family membrane protein YckC